MRIKKSIRKFEYEFDIRAERFIWRHPLWGFFLLFIGVPLFVLTCVCVCTVMVAFPMAWLLGWL